MLTRIASIGLIFILLVMSVFHVLVILQIIPYSIVWGGRLMSISRMYLFESGSLILTIIFLFTILLKNRVSKIVINVTIGLMALVFFINTIGNLLSKNLFEKTVFTPITLVMCFFCLVLLVKKDESRS